MENIAALYDSKFMPFFRQTSSEVVMGLGQKKLQMRRFLNPAAAKTILIVSGRAENMIKYTETIYDLFHRGFNVYAYDHRGQGESERLLANSQIGHVVRFSDYADDLDTVFKAIGTQQNFTVFGHSMGCAVLADYLNRYSYGHIHSCLFSSPMFRIKCPQIIELLLHSYVNLMSKSGFRDHFFKPGGPINVDTYGSDLTDCLPRLQVYREALRANPKMILGSPSFGWLQQSLKFLAQLQPITLHIPHACYLAGEDSVVGNPAAHRILSCPISVFKGVKHDVQLSDSETRADFLTQICEFTDQVAKL